MKLDSRVQIMWRSATSSDVLTFRSVSGPEVEQNAYWPPAVTQTNPPHVAIFTLQNAYSEGTQRSRIFECPLGDFTFDKIWPYEGKGRPRFVL